MESISLIKPRELSPWMHGQQPRKVGKRKFRNNKGGNKRFQSVLSKNGKVKTIIHEKCK
jgi:hypothetical protein